MTPAPRVIMKTLIGLVFIGAALMLAAGVVATIRAIDTGDPRWLASIILGFGGGPALFVMAVFLNRQRKET